MIVSNSKGYTINWISWSFFILCSVALLISNFLSKEINNSLSYSIKKEILDIRYLINGGILEYFTDLSNKSKTIEELRNENLYLRDQISKIHQVEIERNYYKNQLEMLNKTITIKQNKNIDSMLATTIISNNLATFNSNLSVGVGSQDGITSNQLVISNKGIIGYTYEVKNKDSKILNILESSFKISAITEKSNVNVIISGNNSEQPDIVPYSQDIPLINGEIVYTSGLEGKFPRYIPIGQIVLDTNNEKDISWKVNLFEDLKNIHYVYIIK